MNEEITTNFAILILSCDKYADLWDLALMQFQKNFPTCPFKIYWGSNKQSFNHSSVISLLSGEDLDWSSSYLSILKQIPEKKIFVLLEDLLVVSPIDLSRFMSCVEFLQNQHVKHIKYWSQPAPDCKRDKLGFQIYERGAPYRATVCGFWDRECLQQLLIPGENPWNFEILGSYRTSYMDGFYRLDFPLFNFINLIEKGCWIPDSIKKAQSCGIEIDTSYRKILEGKKALRSFIQRIYFNLVLRVPWRRRVAAMAFLRKLLVSY